MYIGIETSLVGIVVNLLVGYIADRVARTTILRVTVFTSIFSSAGKGVCTMCMYYVFSNYTVKYQHNPAGGTT